MIRLLSISEWLEEYEQELLELPESEDLDSLYKQYAESVDEANTELLVSHCETY